MSNVSALLNDIDELKMNVQAGRYSSEIQQEMAVMLASFLRPETVSHDRQAARWLVLGWALDHHLQRRDDGPTGG